MPEELWNEVCDTRGCSRHHSALPQTGIRREQSSLFNVCSKNSGVSLTQNQADYGRTILTTDKKFHTKEQKRVGLRIVIVNYFIEEEKAAFTRKALVPFYT